MSTPMIISPKYNVDHWKAITFSTETDWEKAIEIFEDRIRGRFLTIIEKFEHEEFAGFAVLALDCLLIETLQQFREGVPSTPWGKGEGFFVRFLTQTSFKSDFDEEKSEMFYEQVRNGILHQAEVKGPSRIRTDTPSIVAFSADRKGLVINRRKFHLKMVRVFDEHLDTLRGGDSSLRTNFRKKMDFICRIVDGNDTDS